MYLNYSKLGTDQMKQPVLRLRTLAGKELGVIPWVNNLNFELNYADVSQVEFDVPRHSDGKINPVYQMLASYKMLYTDQLGIYVLQRPTTSGDGVSEVKHITGYSLEQLFEKKMLFLEEGTYNFWNPVQPEDTILGRVLELDTTWSVGYVDPKLIGCYRTFDEYDSDVLNFCYGSVMEKYNCTIVFDVYAKTISAYDAGKSRGTVPIYLSYKNLVDAVDLEELTDDMVTKLHLYGSDDLSIREVNPIGTDYMVDLSYFISNGDFDIVPEGSTVTLSERVKSWNAEIKSNQNHYTNLVAVRASKTAQRLAEEATLASLNSDLEVLIVQQSTIIQAIALETTSAGKATQQKNLEKINDQISAKNAEIEVQEAVIANLQAEIDQCAADIKGITEQLAISKYFTTAEQKILNLYLIEGEAADETFVATDVDTTVSGTSSTLQGKVELTDSDIAQADLNGKKMYAIAGGTLKIASARLTADIVRGTLEINPSTNAYVLTMYMGTTVYDEHSFPSGLITASGTLSQFNSDIVPVTQDGVTENKGAQFSFEADTSRLFFTVNANEYQQYSVAQELYDFGEELLAEWAWPVYEFSIDTANFLFQKEFEPFKNKLEFGKSIYLNVGDGGVIEPKLIGVSLDFENPESLTLTFSNRFQKRDVVANWLSDVNKANASSRSFDTSKYLYNRVANKTTQVSQFMQNALDAAVNTIIGASNQSVVINGAGIQVGGDSKYQLRIVDNMIAMTDDNWATAKLAVGLFATEESGAYFGVNAEVIGGKLIVGNNLIIENQNDQGVMQFKVDASGAWLYNSTFVLQKDNGGCMILDPKYGLLAGTDGLFTTDGTTVLPSFLGADGEVELERDGMPANTNVFIDSRDGSAYFRGNVYATDGVFNGTVYATDGKFTGEIEATKGTFSGTIKAATLDGKLVGGATGGALEGISLNIGDGNFIVDTGGNVSMAGSINLSGGTITWGQNGPVRYQFSTNGTSGWHETMAANDKYRRDSLDGGITWGQPYQFRGEDGMPGSDGSDANVTFNNILRALQTAADTKTTFITADQVGAPTIYGAKIYGAEIYAGGVDEEGGQIISLADTGIRIWNGNNACVLTIHETNGKAAITTGYNDLIISAPNVNFLGVQSMNFTGVDTIGLHATFA